MTNLELKKCVDALKEVRRSMQDDADSCITPAFDEAMAKLERCEAEDHPSVEAAAREALGVLSEILTCVGFVIELVKFFGA